MLIKVYKIIRNLYIKRSNNKKQKELDKRFLASKISLTVKYDDNTKLEGENVIGRNVDISSSMVGRCTVIGSDTHLPNCKIGRFCSLSSGIKVQPYTHPTSFVSTYPGFFRTTNNYPFGKGTKEFKETINCKDNHFAIIGNDVWIGADVTIKGGVVIGDGAVIGMNSLVTKDVPPYAIVGGVPARIIRYRFDDLTIKKLLNIKWWNWPIELIKERRDWFTNVNYFVNQSRK